MLERLVVAVIVAAACAYAVWALTPAVVRARLARRLVAATGRSRAHGAPTRLLGWLAARLEQAAGGGSPCAGCDAHSPATDRRRPTRR